MITRLTCFGQGRGIKAAVVFIGILFFFSQIILAGSATVHVRTDYDGMAWDHVYNSFEIFIANSVKLSGMKLGFRIYSPDGATWTWNSQSDGYGPSQVVTVPTPSRMYPGYLVWEATGLVVDETHMPDTIYVSGTSDTGGIESGPSQTMLRMHFTPFLPPHDYLPHAICIAPILDPPSSEFLFIDAATGDTIVPGIDGYEGQWCFEVAWDPGCPVDYHGPYSMTIRHCETGSVTGYLSSYEPGPYVIGQPVISGGGGIATASGSLTVTYDPAPSDVGKTIEIYVPLSCPNHPPIGGCWVQVTVTNDPAQIDAGESLDALAINQHVVKTIMRNDDDPCDVPTFTIISGPGGIDPVTGVYSWVTAFSDVGLHEVIVELTDGVVAVRDTFSLRVHDRPDWPGNANCMGGVDIGDAVYLINYIFKGGARPPVLNWGDANHDCAINVGDAVYIVNYIFRSGSAPQPGCME